MDLPVSNPDSLCEKKSIFISYELIKYKTIEWIFMFLYLKKKIMSELWYFLYHVNKPDLFLVHICLILYIVSELNLPDNISHSLIFSKVTKNYVMNHWSYWDYLCLLRMPSFCWPHTVNLQYCYCMCESPKNVDFVLQVTTWNSFQK